MMFIGLYLKQIQHNCFYWQNQEPIEIDIVFRDVKLDFSIIDYPCVIIE